MKNYNIGINGETDTVKIKADSFTLNSQGGIAVYSFSKGGVVVASFPASTVLGVLDVDCIAAE